MFPAVAGTSLERANATNVTGATNSSIEVTPLPFHIDKIFLAYIGKMDTTTRHVSGFQRRLFCSKHP